MENGGRDVAANDDDLTSEQRTELAKLYFGAAQESAKEYDERVFWLISGAAAIFAFLLKDLPRPEHWSFICFLLIGWLFMFVSLVSIMLSFLWSSQTHYKWAKYWLWDDASCGDEAASLGGRIRIANWVALVGVLAGIALVGVFMAVNAL